MCFRGEEGLRRRALILLKEEKSSVREEVSNVQRKGKRWEEM